MADIRKKEPELMPYLRPDSKSQVTIEYGDNGKPLRVHTIVVSTQHDDFVAPADDSHAAQLEADRQMLAKIKEDILTMHCVLDGCMGKLLCTNPSAEARGTSSP